MQKSGFPKMRHYVGFSQIGSHMTQAIINLFQVNKVIINDIYQCLY